MQLYAMPGTCALAPNIVAVWGEVQLEVVNLARGDHREPDYLAINPKGQVPALVLDDGRVITEAAAIMRFLAALSTSGNLNPGEALAWAPIDEAMSYFTSEIHADFGGHFAPQRFAATESGQAEVRAATYDKLAQHMARLETTLLANGGLWYLGEPTVADAYLFVILRWIDGTPIDLTEYSGLTAYRARLSLDEGVASALERQDMT
jgi:glutathione S-transferase